jgi:hypothetical protein
MSFGSDPLSKLSEEEILWTEVDEDRGGRRYTSTIDNEMIDGGIIQIITAGFGSNHDSDKFIIAICDDCIQSNYDDGTLLMFKSGGYLDNGEVEKSKKIYKRRKRLDDLTGEL